jgi:hypothetical protein
MSEEAISASRAKAVASSYLQRQSREPEPRFLPWLDADLGEPLLVQTVDLEPSHWVIPVTLGQKTLGRISVSKEGRAMGHAYFYTDPDDLSVCPSVVTRVGREEALRQADERLRAHAGAEISDPVYVLDDHRDRLAWMISILREGEIVSRIFVAPGYVYEREAGVRPRRPGIRG